MKTSKYLLLAAAALLAFWTAGCTTPAARIRRNPEAFARLAPAEQTMIRKGQIGLGFTPEMVKLALGEPDHIHERTDRTGTREIWVYTSYDAPDEPAFYDGWYHRRRYWGWDGPFYPYPLYPGYGYSREHIDFRVVFKDGKVVAVEQRRQ